MLPYRSIRSIAKYITALVLVPLALSSVNAQTTQAVAASAVATPQAGSSQSATPVRIVCLATAPEDFFRVRIAKEGVSESKEAKEALEDLRLMRILAGFEKLLSSGGQAVADKALRNAFPPVGGYFYMPLGTGFVVDSGGQYVVTNWHVANACKQSEFFKTQLGIIESSGRVLESVRAELQTHRIEKKTNGEEFYVSYIDSKLRVLCSENNNACSKTSLKGVDFYAPDLALLKLNVAADGRYARTPPILLANPSELSKDGVLQDKTAALTIAGFPQVVMDAASGANSPGIQSTVPISTPAKYSNEQKFDNRQIGKSVADETEIRLLLLAAQIHSGNSGGPVLLNDKVVGVVTATIMQDSVSKRVQVESNVDNTAANTRASSIPAGYGLAINVKEVSEMLDWFHVKPAAPAVLTQPTPTPTPTPTAPAVCKNGEVKVGEVCSIVKADKAWWDSPIILGLLVLIVVAGGAFFWMLRGKPAPIPKRDPIPVLDPAPTVVHLEPIKITPAQTSLPAAVRLRGSHGCFDDKVFAIPTPSGINTLLVGRDPTVCQITFPNQIDTISKRHCIFSWVQATRSFTVEDLGSTWGTYVNGKKISKGEKVTLRNGDTVDLSADKINRFSVELV